MKTDKIEIKTTRRSANIALLIFFLFYLCAFYSISYSSAYINQIILIIDSISPIFETNFITSLLRIFLSLIPTIFSILFLLIAPLKFLKTNIFEISKSDEFFVNTSFSVIRFLRYHLKPIIFLLISILLLYNLIFVFLTMQYFLSISYPFLGIINLILLILWHEIFFRGILLNYLLRSFKPINSMIIETLFFVSLTLVINSHNNSISSLIFTGIPWSNLNIIILVIPLSIYELILNYLFYKCKNVLPGLFSVILLALLKIEGYLLIPATYIAMFYNIPGLYTWIFF